jgi:hypothetical protein
MSQRIHRDGVLRRRHPCEAGLKCLMSAALSRSYFVTSGLTGPPDMDTIVSEAGCWSERRCS